VCDPDRSGGASARCEETAADARAAKSVVRELESRMEPMLATLVKDTADTKHNLDLHVKKQVCVPNSARCLRTPLTAIPISLTSLTDPRPTSNRT
jgi:hypothetical protein